MVCLLQDASAIPRYIAETITTNKIKNKRKYNKREFAYTMKDIQSHINNENLTANIVQIIREARQTAYRAVNFTMVIAYWNIGRLIVEDELHWERADYGKAVLKNLSERLTKEFGKGFDERELRKMCQFYRCFEIRDTLRPELSWSHYRRLISVENEQARI